MKMRLVILIVCLTVAVSLVGFAALAQTPAISAADNWVPSVYAQLSGRVFSVSRPRGCFCDEDCFAALQEKQRIQSRQRFQSMPSWRPLYPDAENEIRVIDLDGLKKILQRDPKDT